MKKILFFITLIPVFFCNVAFSQNYNDDLDRINQRETQSSQEYWTAERMKNAIPDPLLQDEPSQIQSSKGETETFSKNDHYDLYRVVDQIEPYRPSNLGWTVERMESALPTPLLQDEPPQSQFATEDTETFLPSSNDTTFKTLDASRVYVSTRKKPYSKIGKLYYKKNGQDYYCTAQFVGDDHMILTAAHCLKEPNGVWSSNILFHRGEDDRLGQLVIVRCYAVHKKWNSDINKRKWDYAFAKTTRSNVGYLSFTTTFPYALKAMGYSSQDEKGRVMYGAQGMRGRFIDGTVEMQNNTMRKGVAGGAWFQRDGKTVVGINSSRYSDSTTDVWSPNFDAETMKLYHFVLNQC